MKQLSNIFKVFSAKPLMLLFFFTLLPLMANAQCPDNNHPHMIDLGLPSGTKWACCNVGAQKPEDFGGYYAWGETEEKESYTWENYIHCDGTSETVHDIGTNIAGTQYDVAHVKWGGRWQMPNEQEIIELIDNCTKTWKDYEGMLYTGPNGNKLFVPSMGYGWVDSGNHGNYWTANLSEKDNMALNWFVWNSLYPAKWNGNGRESGYFVRPIVSSSTTSSNIDFADEAVKAICVANWDTNGDGELSYAEAAAVTDIGTVFKGNKDITSFNEFQYFTNVISLESEAFQYCTNMSAIIIPYSVKRIGEMSFYECSSLKTLTISKNINYIGYFSLYGCSSLISFDVEESNMYFTSENGVLFNKDLTTIVCYPLGKTASSYTIPDGVTTIGSVAFCDCTNLTSVTIPNSVTKIGSYAFSGCSNITSLKLPDNLKYIWYRAFQGCTGLKSITLPETLESIDELAFSGCKSLTYLYIPQNVNYIGNSMCAFCSKLTSIDVADGNNNYMSIDGVLFDKNVTTLICYPAGKKGKSYTIPQSVTFLEKYSFSSCSNLTNLEIPSGVTEIREGSFYNCSALASVNLPNGLAKIDDMVFQDCEALTSVTIPNGVTSIGFQAFCYCTSLTSVTIPSSVTNLYYSFINCFNLTDVYCYAEQVPEADTWAFGSSGNKTLHVPAASMDDYKVAEPWMNFKEIVPIIIPVENGESVDIATELDENTNLDGNVVGDVYYCISSGDGSYDPEEGCIVVTKPTDDSAIDGKDIFGEDFKDGYTGFVFMVAPGKGTINVEAETTGNMVLKVKVGDNAPTQMEVNGKTKVSFSYDVSEPTFVYIYGSIGAAGAKGMRKASSTDALKIYGIEVTSETNGIEAIDNGQLTIDNSPVYNLNGQRVISSPSGRPGGVPTKGIYIQNGKKVLVK
ncbi:MAG: leucine-rich repeat domain-containing protein [Prevotella sp.]|nr:leucine-rich repeat domain-containing protein [Prevotella sp.]